MFILSHFLKKTFVDWLVSSSVSVFMSVVRALTVKMDRMTAGRFYDKTPDTHPAR